jgi:Zn-dependent protease with chaperone function
MLDQIVLKHLKAEPLTHEKAFGLYQAANEIARSLGIQTPTFHLAPQILHSHPIINGMVNSPNAASLSSTAIMLSEPILRLFESMDLSKPISQEFKAVIAHEMHHCANRTSMMMMSRVPVFALPAAALTGLYLYDRAHAKAKKENNVTPENMVKHIETTTSETRASLPKETEQSSLLNNILYYGKYLAVAVAATGVGLWIARHGARYHEFAADSFAAGAVHNRESMVSALRKIHQAAGQSISEHHQAGAFKGIIAETLHAHPSFAERVTNIRR